MRPRVTQRDIARQAGVSHATVSLALRGDASIPDETRKKIEMIAASIGYSPDPMLTALSSYRKQNRPPAYHANIAYLTSHQDDPGDFGLYLDGAKSRAQQLGYVVDEIPITGHEKNFDWLRRLLDARNITGLLLAPSTGPGCDFTLDLSRYSAVRLGYSFQKVLLHTVANAQFRTVLTAMQKVASMGYQRVGIILSEEVDERTSWHFLGAYHAGQHFLPKKEWIAPFYASGREVVPGDVAEWIVREKVDCLVAAGYRSLYWELIKCGLDFPATIGYADTQVDETDEYFSGIHQNARQIGRAAIDLLVGMMHRNETGVPEFPSHLLIEGAWHVGKTLPPRDQNVS